MYCIFSDKIIMICSALYGGNTTFSIYVTLKEYFPLYFCKVSMVFDIPRRTRLTVFLRKSDKKSYETISGADLNKT